MTDAELLRFCDFVRDQVGLDFPQKIWGSLRRNLARGAAAHGFGSVVEFTRWITETPGQGKKLDILVGLLTVGETFFFRDQKALEAIDRVIVPYIVGTKPELNKTVRIWSAGCSTGEEPYSIAILLKRSLWASSNQQVKILGTDINKESLEKAKKAIYKEWSFRGVPSWLKKDHFSRVPGGYELDPKIRSMVEFRRLNLASFDYSSVLGNFGPVDLVLCRNTLMYFTSEVRKRIIGKVLFWLNTGGWLLVGPSEVPHVVHRKLKLVTLPGAIFFRRNSGAEDILRSFQSFEPQAIRTIKPDKEKDWWIIDELQKAKAPVLKHRPFAEQEPHENLGLEEELQKARQEFELANYNETVNILKNLSSNIELDPALLGPICYLLAKAYANLGMLKEAQDSIEQALKVDKLNIAYHHIFASILQANEMLEEASKRLERILFLDPDHIMANVTLATIQTKLNNKSKALRHIRNSMTLLDGLSPEEVVPDSDGASADHLREMVKSAMLVVDEKNRR
ncbi:MAG: CheR family methyltransferase [Desulfomonilaceae bacterium]